MEGVKPKSGVIIRGGGVRGDDDSTAERRGGAYANDVKCELEVALKL